MVTGVVLAGGKSSRMGQNKALIEILGVPMLSQQIRKLKDVLPVGSDVLVSVREQSPMDLPEGVRYVADEIPDEGPLMGLFSCMNTLSDGHVLLLGVDLPRIDGDFLNKLLDQVESEKGVVPYREKSEMYEPLVAIYPIALKSKIETFLQSGERSFQAFIREGIESGCLKQFVVEPDHSRKFMNVNCPEDLVEFVGQRA